MVRLPNDFHDVKLSIHILSALKIISTYISGALTYHRANKSDEIPHKPMECDRGKFPLQHQVNAASGDDLVRSRRINFGW